MDDKFLLKAYLAKKTQMEMMKFRNYQLPAKEEKVLELLEKEPISSIKRIFEENYGILSSNKFDNKYTDKEDPKRTALVFYSFEDLENFPQKSKKVLKIFLELILNYHPQEAILVTYGDLNKNSKENFKEIALDKFIQHFTLEQLQLNPFKHLNTPKMWKLSPEEAKEKYKAFHLADNQTKNFLSIRSDDPVVKFAGWKIGDLIRIERFNYQFQTIELFSNNYRVVV
jgi:DNA-directed RNA polymerase subunit H (RpoH/RPB5)